MLAGAPWRKTIFDDLLRGIRPRSSVYFRPELQVAKLMYTPEPIEIHRVNQYRAITVSALPKPGHVASEVTDPLMPALRKFEAALPDGYRWRSWAN